MMTFTEQDIGFMRRALALARRGEGLVEPNPMVGAVVVREGKVVGEGYHRRYGGAHAEVEALRIAGRRAKGATVYVTLEPCCHWGKTPPCTDALLAADVSRVVAAMVDPFAKVRGKGAAILRKAGVRVDVGLLEAEARALNAPFITRVKLGRPYVIAKWAQSVDGALATAAGDSKWISSEASRGFVHRLRARVDGILVGGRTAAVDDPLLTARGTGVKRIATRIVVDSMCALSVGSKLVKSVSEAPVMVAHLAKLPGGAERRRKGLEARGVNMVGVRADRKGRVDLERLMGHLGEMEYTNVLVEGGAELLSAFFEAGLVDEAHVFIAPMLIGGKDAPRVWGGDLRKVADAARMVVQDVWRSGPDVHLTMRTR